MVNYSTYKHNGFEFHYIPDRTAVCPPEDNLFEIYVSMTSSLACKSENMNMSCYIAPVLQ